jgi:hypothetical protein
MPSTIETIARTIANHYKNGGVKSEDIASLIEAVTICDNDPDGKKAQFRALAIEHHQKDGELEIDDEAIVSISEDDGAYIQAWIWVELPHEDEEDNDHSTQEEIIFPTV